MPNTIQLDPTRTTTLRAQYSREMRRRFNKVRGLVIQAVGDLDVLGLDDRQPQIFNIVSNALPERQAFRFATSERKVKAFNSWLQEQVDAEILTTDVRGDPWTSRYVGSAYRKGSVRAYIDAHAEELAETPEWYRGRREQFLESAFAQPERLSKIKLLYTRSYEDLKGITAQMSRQISLLLADGMAHGRGPRQIARDLSKSITEVTKKRALTMARTEIIHAHAEGQLDSFEELGVRKLRVLAEWSTAGDDRVCPRCAALSGTVMTVKEARGLIPRHPNCRCAWIPANVGETVKGKRFWTKGDKERRVKRSLLAELPHKTRAGKKVPQTVSEARRRSTWAGKDVTFKEASKPIDLKPSFKRKPKVKKVAKKKAKAKPEPKPPLKAPKEITGKPMHQLKPEMSKWTEQKLPGQAKSAAAWTDDELQAYKTYKRGGDADINGHLRHGKPLAREANKDVIKHIDRTVSPLDEDVVTYRGFVMDADSELDRALRPGMEFLDKGFTSTSFDDDIARGFVERERADLGAIMEVRVPKGHKASYLDFTGAREVEPSWAESELLLQRGSRFRILSREQLETTERKIIYKIVAEVF